MVWWVIIGLLAVAIAGLTRQLARVGGRYGQADWGGPFLNRLDGLMRVFCARFHRLEYEPLPVPVSGGAIVAANHLSGLDPIILAAASGRPLRYVIATEQYERRMFRWFYDQIGCIPVDRTGAPDKAFYAARRALAAGEVIVLFPQGGIRLPDDPRKPLKRGVIALAAMANVPVIPARISGVGGVGRIVAAVFIRSRARIHAGQPVLVDGRRDDQALLAIEEFISRGVYRDYRHYFGDYGKYIGPGG
ncbi:MAG: lysophospholipid acyltransferase family protein [Gammaproteobacteria bacterium]|nr:lysophospholipid acyltransferase family protein [Gammaproteobacteria bacterium]